MSTLKSFIYFINQSVREYTLHLLFFVGFLYETFRHRQGLGEGGCARGADLIGAEIQGGQYRFELEGLAEGSRACVADLVEGEGEALQIRKRAAGDGSGEGDEEVAAPAAQRGCIHSTSEGHVTAAKCWPSAMARRVSDGLQATSSALW